LVAAWLMGFALATRWAVLGDLAYFNDEYFYWVAALRIHDGLLPYVDVWDRKGPGLFLTYWLITGVYRGVLGFQVAALLSTAATAFTLARIARRFTGPVARWGGHALSGDAADVWRRGRAKPGVLQPVDGAGSAAAAARAPRWRRGG
jgi:hypothetical protein